MIQTHDFQYSHKSSMPYSTNVAIIIALELTTISLLLIFNHFKDVNHFELPQHPPLPFLGNLGLFLGLIVTVSLLAGLVFMIPFNYLGSYTSGNLSPDHKIGLLVHSFILFKVHLMPLMSSEPIDTGFSVYPFGLPSSS